MPLVYATVALLLSLHPGARTAGGSVMYCPTCGTSLPAAAKFCLNCGAPITATAGSSSHAQQQPHWEYKVFTEPLGSMSFRLKGFFWQDSVPPVTKGDPKAVIDAAVMRLLQRIARDGWEPMEMTDANSLWKAGHVTRTFQKRHWYDSDNGVGTFTLVELQVSCRRRTTS